MTQTHDCPEARDARRAGSDRRAALVDRPTRPQQLEADERAALRRSDRAIQAHKPTTASTTHMEGHAHRDILEHHRTRDHRLTDRHNTQLGVFRQTKERERETPSEKPPALFVTTGLPTVLKPPRVREWVGLQHNLMQLPVDIEVVDSSEYLGSHPRR